MAIEKALARAVFLDRDGTIIHEAHYLTDPAEVKLYNGAARALSQLKRQGFKLVVVSNQSGIGRGWVSVATVNQINKKMCRLLGYAAKVSLDAIYFCPHAPADRCACRKPKVLMLKKAGQAMGIALGNSYMIGDKVIDIELAQRAGAGGIFVLTGHGRQERVQLKSRGAPKPLHVAGNLAAAARWILKKEKNLKNYRG